METEIFRNVKNSFKRAFKRHQDNLYKTVQSKPVDIGTNTYVLVGQMRLQAFPLVSHFDVFDDVGQSANEDIGRDVYTFVSLLMLSKYIRKIKETLDRQSKQAVTNDQLRSLFKGMDEKDAKCLSSFPVQATEQLASFLRSVDEVTAKERWDMSDIDRVKYSWDPFCKTYSERADALMRVYSNQRALRGKEDVDHQATQSIWEEASLFSKLTESLTPMNATNGQFSLNELIVYHYDFGRLRRGDERLESIAKMERWLYRVIVILMRVFIVFALLVVMMILTDDGFVFVEVFPFVFFLLIGSFVKGQNKRRLIVKNDTYLTELRAMSVVQGKESQEIEQTNEMRRPPGQSLYETIVVSMDLVKVFALLTAVCMIVTIALLVEGDVDYVALQYVFYVNVGLFLFTVYLPFSRLSKRKVVITDDAIYIWKEKVSALELIRIVVKNEGRDVELFVNYNDNPFTLKIQAEERESCKRALKLWCAQNRIVFQDKDRSL